MVDCMKYPLVAITLSLLTSACGTGDGDSRGETNGSSVDGQINGLTIEPEAAFVISFEDADAIVLTEDPTAECDPEPAQIDGDSLIITLYCGARIGTLPIDADTFECDGADPAAFMFVETAAGQESEALSGAVDITASGGVVRGTFVGDFGSGGSLSGSFAARRCP